jgi:hypothetical protein
MKSLVVAYPERGGKRKVNAHTDVLASLGKSRGSTYQQSKSYFISKTNSEVPSSLDKNRTRCDPSNSTIRPRKEKASGATSHCDLIVAPHLAIQR